MAYRKSNRSSGKTGLFGKALPLSQNIHKIMSSGSQEKDLIGRRSSPLESHHGSREQSNHVYWGDPCALPLLWVAQTCLDSSVKDLCVLRLKLVSCSVQMTFEKSF